jgi:hypothetical protein
MSEPVEDQGLVDVKITRVVIEKRDANGEVFEVIEGGDGVPTKVTYRREGEPPESYADVGKD